MRAKIPQLFIQRLQQILSAEDYRATVQSLEQTETTIFRLNKLLTDANALLSHLQSFAVKEIDWLVKLYSIPTEQRADLTESDCYANGEFYMQNPASVLPVLVLDPKPDDEVLDLAAAPGGKTIFIAECMKNQGRLAAVEKIKPRFFKLQANLKCYGVTNTKTYLKDGCLVWRHCENRFDKVLLDAPCSSEARIKTFDPKSYQFWSERKIKEMQRKQKKLLYSAIKCLKPGGQLVYSTCSFAPEENEAVVNAMLKKFDNVEILPIDLPLENIRPGLIKWQKQTYADSLQNARRIIPDALCHGFFICLLTKPI